MKLVYADHAASTPTDPYVAAKVFDILDNKFANPSSLHSFGREAAMEVTKARKVIAEFISAENPEEIFFTSSGTESNNLALLGVAKANKTKGKHIITTAIEHPSIMNACKALERDGYEISYLPVDKDGQINLEELERTLTEQTILVSIGYGNSEIGTLQEIEDIGSICSEKNVYFHVDACQAMVFKKIDVQKSNIDLLTFNGSKMYGPKGIAALYVREGVNIFPIFYGGGQQKSLRSGTENVAGIAGLAKAAQRIEKKRDNDTKRINQLRNMLQKACAKIDDVEVNISKNRLPNHLSIRFESRTNADLVKEMDKHGIAVSSGSACSSSSLTDSHILTAIGLTSAQAQSTLRITLGRGNMLSDINAIYRAVRKISREK